MEQLSINLQWQSFLRHCAQHAKNGLIAELDCGVTVYWTQTTMSFLNTFFLSSAVLNEADLRRRLEEIKAYVARAKPTFECMLVIEPELLPADLRERSKEICLAADFAHHMDGKCMQTASLLPPVRPLPDTEIRFASSQKDVYDVMLLNTEAYHMDASAAESVVENHAVVIDFDKQLCYIVLIDGKPVSTATTLLLDDCLYVALVATSAQHRKHGYAEVALRASVEHALKTFPRTKHDIVLHASELGQHVYERMGFKDISHVEMYVHKPVIRA